MPTTRDEHGQFGIETHDETTVLHTLTGWSLESQTPLIGLRVERLTLEDVYLSLTSDGRSEGTLGTSS